MRQEDLNSSCEGTRSCKYNNCLYLPDWMSHVEKKKGKQGGERKMEEQTDLTEIFQEARKQTNLPVCCGNKKGDLYREKYYIGEKCILCKGKWYSPHQFEIIGGKGHNKKWKTSIYYKPSNGFQQVQLLKLIQSGVLPEFGHLKESLFRPVAQTDGRNKNEIPVRGQDTSQLDSSSDESTSVAKRLKLNKRKTVMLAETVSKTIIEPVGSTASDRDSPAHPVDASEPGVSPVIEEAVQTTDDPNGAGQLSLSASPAKWQNPVASEETQETRQLQLYELLTKQFNTINNTLQSIDLSLKKLVEKQSHDTLSQSITPHSSRSKSQML